MEKLGINWALFIAQLLNVILLVWLLSRSRALLPIPGTSKLEHLEDNVSAAALRFTAAEMRRIA